MRMTGRGSVRAGVVLANLGLAVTVAACGSSTTAPTASSSSAAAAAAATADGLVVAERGSSSFPTTITPFNASAAKGKKVWWISNLASNSFTTLIYNPFVQAMALENVGVHLCDGQGSASIESRCIEEAIVAHPDQIFIQDLAIASVQKAINDAHAAKIPVTEWANDNAGTGPAPGDVAETTYCYSCAGTNIVDDVVALSKGNVNAVIITSSDVPVSSSETQAIEAEFAKICPVTCHFKTEDVLIANWTTGLPVMARTIVADPGINWIIPMFDPETTFLDPAIVAAGAASRVHVASYNATSGAVQQLQAAGNPLWVDVGSSLTWSGYACADMVLRVLAGVTPLSDTAESIPIRDFDRTNASSVDFSKPDSTWYGSTNFIASYKTAWGITS
jgi:ribose transport system substrate-binding protein